MAKILIIDDEPKILEMYLSRFQETQHILETACDGEECIKKVYEFKPDIILLDILMPKMNGFEVLKRLKKEDETKLIPVILLTNVGGSEQDLKKSLALGAETYMVKASYTSKQVKERVEQILETILQKKNVQNT